MRQVKTEDHLNIVSRIKKVREVEKDLDEDKRSIFIKPSTMWFGHDQGNKLSVTPRRDIYHKHWVCL